MSLVEMKDAFVRRSAETFRFQRMVKKWLMSVA